MTRGGRCHPLSVLDDHSRFALTVRACDNEREGTVRAHLTAVFRRFALPERVLCHDGVVEVCLGAHAIGRVDLRAERAMPRRRLSLATLTRPAGAG